MRSIALTACAILASGCASIPPLQEEYSISVTDIVENIRCELASASRNVYFVTKPLGWLAAMDLSLKVIAAGEAGVGITSTVPLSPGSAKLSAGAGTSGSADRSVTFSFSADFTDPTTIPCTSDMRSGRGVRLSGNLGIDEWLANLQQTMTATGFKPEKVGYVLEFTLVRNAGGGVEISAVPAGNSILGGSLSFGGTRTDVHTLSIAYLEKSPPPPKKPTGRKAARPASSSDKQELQNDLNNLIFRQNNPLR